MDTFSPRQVEMLLGAMSGATEGYRDVAIVLTILDMELRVNELINLILVDVWLDESLIKVLGKGNKKRPVPNRETDSQKASALH